MTLKSNDTEELSTVNYVDSRGQKGQRLGYRSHSYDVKQIFLQYEGINPMQTNCTVSIGA